MDLAYHNTHVTYERVGDTLTPVRIRKEWVNKRFVVVRMTNLSWAEVTTPIDVWRTLYKDGAPWTSRNTAPLTRAALIQHGEVWEPGRGMPCLHILPQPGDRRGTVYSVRLNRYEVPDHILNGELPAFAANMTNKEVTRYARAALYVDRPSVDRDTLPP